MRISTQVQEKQKAWFVSIGEMWWHKESSITFLSVRKSRTIVKQPVLFLITHRRKEEGVKVRERGREPT